MDANKIPNIKLPPETKPEKPNPNTVALFTITSLAFETAIVLKFFNLVFQNRKV